MTDASDAERSPRAWLARPTGPRSCAYCGRQFLPAWPSTKYCSPACRTKANESRRPGRKRPTED